MNRMAMEGSLKKALHIDKKNGNGEKIKKIFNFCLVCKKKQKKLLLRMPSFNDDVNDVDDNNEQQQQKRWNLHTHTEKN